MDKLKTILIVDDNEDNVDILCEILEEKYELFASLDGEEALEIVSEEKIDLILLDIMMPNIDGFEVCRRLKSDEKTKSIPVIFITAKTDEDSIEKAYEIGAVDYINKPFRTAEILSRINTHLQLASQKENLRKKVYEAICEVQDLNKVLEEQKKDLILANEAKDMFLANMSHELKTPLNSINVISSVMRKNKENNLNEKQIKNLEVINMCGQSLLFMINDVLDISKLEAGKIELVLNTFDLRVSMDNLNDMILPQAEANGINFKYEIDDNIKLVYSDEFRVNQIIKNLLSNSLKFAKNGNILLKVEDDKEFIKISVKDDGIGIKEDKLEFIFDRFKQVDGTTTRKYGGNGLGLSISSELSKLLNGTLKVESEYEKGSTFTLRFPKNEEQINKKTLTSNDEKNQKENILVLSKNFAEIMPLIVRLNSFYKVKHIMDLNLFFQEINNDYKIIIIDDFDSEIDKLKDLKSKIFILTDNSEKYKEICQNICEMIVQKPIDLDKLILRINDF